MNYLQFNKCLFSFIYVFLWLFCVSPVLGKQTATTLSLQQAVVLAQANDPWLNTSKFRQQVLEAQSISASSWPDPQVNLAIANLATDTFTFKQEQMTQFKVGVSQTLPRGDTPLLQKEYYQTLAQQKVLQRDTRLAQIQVTVSQLWLDVYQAKETIKLIKKNRELFLQLIDVAESSYSSAFGGTRQQDIVNSQLEFTRLEARLNEEQEQHDTQLIKLCQWLTLPLSNIPIKQKNNYQDFNNCDITLPSKLPAILPLTDYKKPLNENKLMAQFSQHPTIKVIDLSIQASSTNIHLAQQNYKPQWQFHASYGYRDRSPTREKRADFFSFDVTFDLPLFPARRQDQHTQAAIANNNAIKIEKLQALRDMMTLFEVTKARLVLLSQRHDLYQNELLSKMKVKAESYLTAYTNDDGKFSEAIRARIEELDTQIEALNTEVERLKEIIQYNYFINNDSKV